MAKEVVLQPLAYSLSEFTLDTAYTSRELSKSSADLSVEIARGFRINIPFLSAAMQAVTGPELATELARCGGLGVIYCSQPLSGEAEMVRQVKAMPPNAAEYTYPFKTLVDKQGRLVVGAAINTKDYAERVPALVNAGADILFIDSSHGNTDYQKETLEFVKQHYPHIPIVGGNIINADGVNNLVNWGATGVKVGMGIGSICITTDVKATGKGQASAVMECVATRDKLSDYIPVIADGGIGTAREMCIALALGADAVMLGKYFARFEEAPGNKISRSDFLQMFPGVDRRLDPSIEYLKEYWGEGSLRARIHQEAQYRYGQNEFAEGVDSYIEYAGGLKENLGRTLAKIIKSMHDAGANSVKELREKAVVRLASAKSMSEAGAHDLISYHKVALS
ncbi:IMP dehydrogenase [Patescibacteria group bacterium]|nr:IMP dehydrogenase [Patescibacteria group bacterium]